MNRNEWLVTSVYRQRAQYGADRGIKGRKTADESRTAADRVQRTRSLYRRIAAGIQYEVVGIGQTAGEAAADS